VNIRQKLILGFLTVSLLVLLVAYFGIDATDSIHNAYAAEGEETLPVIRSLEGMKLAGIRIVASTHEFIHFQSGNETYTPLGEKEYQDVLSGVESYDKSFEQYEKLVNRFFPDERVILENIRIAGQRLKKISFELIDLKNQEASEIIIKQKHEEFEEAETDFQQAVDDALAAEDNEFAERTERVGITIDNTKKTIILVSLLTILMSILIGIYISYSFSRPIVQLKDAAAQIIRGNMDAKVEICSKDEIGSLAEMFNQMTSEVKKHRDHLDAFVTERTFALVESEEKYHTLYESSSDAIMLLDEKGFFDCNNATLRIFGFSNKEEFTKVHPSQVSPPYQPDGMDSLTAANNKIAEAFRTGTNQFEWMHRRQNGEDFPADVLLTAFNLKGKQVLQATVRDISERKRVERELLLAKEEAERASAVKSEFLAKMSHELRTPLNAVIGFSEFLKMKGAGELNEKQERYIDNILNSGKHLFGIISDMLDLVKVESGEKLPLSLESFPAPEAIDETLIFVNEKAAQKKIVITKEIDPGLGAIIADKLRFKQILMNLLDNAIKFSKPEGGMITIAARKADGMAQFSVSDTGIGIKEEDMGKLFDLFHQVDSGISRKYGGAGIGLPIVKQLVEQHGGRILVESIYGEGTTFTFTLPLEAKKEVFK